ncbi:hypothetical protein Deipr_2461 (plasmid) [Deinococcus proteolyticus MRP]|uniref:Prepilin-type N-terminal cleavage/methylation domain-containing protein n=1 Tax=Deinococcus proteolyticus (strain ATCC 35074 / DSM 20540 / JCM 6276 / NBRC 101906 / NCIMB 13154 / VKM Ac-1939 / CCM 2703 / MRP) TaxID=693977 RepID=F0RQL9_DEIPM|nr:hypothetical protein [Deinococcus proteolyticus]ADY27578.1 hypothetical protein Deipr_2461 [Deinococcus proteolyticus MRP]
MKQHMHGYTLIEVLLALGATAALVGGVAAIVTPAMQASRDDTLTAAENIQLSRTTDQLVDDIAGGKVILRQASTQRLDFLRLSALQPTQLPGHLGNGKETQIQLDTDVFGPYAGKDVLLTNTTGDYLITKVEKTEASSGKYTTTFECPLTLPGTLTAHTFAPLNIASTQATGGGGQPNSLYRDSGGGWELASTGVGRVTFQPGEGAPFTADLQPVEREIKQLSIGLGNEGDRKANTLAPAIINPAAWKEWSCGEGMSSRPENNLGNLQINVALEGNPNPSNPGVSPSVAASGPQDQSLSRFGTQVFEKLKPGLYNVSANTITIGGNPYDPVITGSPANIGKGRAGTVNVNYVERRGIMTITVSGLPAGQTGQVRVQGRENKTLPKSIAGIPVIDQPGGAFLINLKNGEYPIELLPGEYTVTAAGSGTLDAVVTPGTLAVRPGQNSPVSVAYAAAQGSATVQVRGLYSGEKTTVSLTSSAGTRQHTITGNGTGFDSANIPLNPGTYTISGSEISGRTLSISAPTLTIVPRQTSLTMLSYASNGTMQVTVKGLSAGEQGKVSVAGPQNVSQSLGEGTFSINLKPGSYTVSAEPVNGKTPTVTPANVAITSNKTAGVVVEYRGYQPVPCDPRVDASCLDPKGGTGTISINQFHTKSSQYNRTTEVHDVSVPNWDLDYPAVSLANLPGFQTTTSAGSFAGSAVQLKGTMQQINDGGSGCEEISVIGGTIGQCTSYASSQSIGALGYIGFDKTVTQSISLTYYGPAAALQIGGELKQIIVPNTRPFYNLMEGEKIVGGIALPAFKPTTIRLGSDTLMDAVNKGRPLAFLISSQPTDLADYYRCDKKGDENRNCDSFWPDTNFILNLTSN